MAIKIRTQWANPEWYNIDLSVIISDMTITVGSGVFQAKGKSYTLSDEYEHVIEPSSEVRSVFVYVAEVKATGEAIVVVDEQQVGDGAFPWEGSLYTPLYRVVVGSIPGDTVSLDTADITIKKVLPLEDTSDEPVRSSSAAIESPAEGKVTITSRRS